MTRELEIQELQRRIHIHDGLIPKELQDKLTAIVQKPIWAYGWKSNSEKDRYSFWHTHFAGGDLNSRVDCAAQLQQNHPAIFQLWDLLSKTILQDHVPLRAYGNAHTFGTEGYIHVDNRDTDNYFSTIIYTNEDWKAFWGGETMFYTLDEKDIIKAAAALPFRITSFPGHIPHKANAPSRDCPQLRTAIVFKSHRPDLRKASVQPTLVLPTVV